MTVKLSNLICRFLSIPFYHLQKIGLGCLSFELKHSFKNSASFFLNQSHIIIYNILCIKNINLLFKHCSYGYIIHTTVLNLTIESVSSYMVAAAKLFEENSIGNSQSAVKEYLRMKIEVRLGKVDYIDD